MNNNPKNSALLHHLEQTFSDLLAQAEVQGLSREILDGLENNRQQFNDHLLYTDGRFDLPNEAAFYKTVEELIATGKSDQYSCMMFNIRDFKKTNTIIGPEASNIILGSFLEGLHNMTDSDEYLFTKGWDDGLILCRCEHMNRFLDYLHCTSIEYNPETHEMWDVHCAVGCNRNIGNITIHFMVMDSVSLPLKLARAGKAQGRWCVFWDKSIDLEAESQAHIEALIPKALKNEEFLVYYQPKVNLKKYSLTGAEALCRWSHDGQILPPDQFIPLMEQNGSIGELDFYMLDHVCADIRRWIDSGIRPVQISVNLSRVNIQSEQLLERLISTVDAHQVPHTFIQIELTETTTDVGFSELKNLMEGLRSAGFSMAIDDFGTGYSSMSIIRNLPWNVIKIDKSLLHEHTDPKRDKHLMFKSIAHMVQTMGLEAIVEGVETIQDINLLKENDCSLAQGYFFDHPLPVKDFEHRLQIAQG